MWLFCEPGLPWARSSWDLIMLVGALLTGSYSAYSPLPGSLPWSQAWLRASAGVSVQQFIGTKVLALTAALGMRSEGPRERVRGPTGALD